MGHAEAPSFDLTPEVTKIVALSLANHLPTIEADASQLQQLIMNLVINAAEAIDGHGGAVLVVGSSGYDQVNATNRFGVGVAAFLQKPYKADVPTRKVALILRGRSGGR